MDSNPLLIILGPTASGKTKLAVALADALQGEIISADSRQVFRGMDIGTGKDLEEYIINGHQIPYHLIDIKNPGDKYNVDAFKEDFYEAFTDITQSNKLPILCGGTGMYIHSLLQPHHFTSIPVNEDLRNSFAQKTIEELREVLVTYPIEFTKHADLSSSKRIIRAIEIAAWLSVHGIPEKKTRPIIDTLLVGLTSDVESRRKRIEERLDIRLNSGLIEEVEDLLHKGVSKEILTFYGLEYKFVVSFLNNEISREEMRDLLYIAIRQYSKRQMTFFRKMEKDGVKIHWFDTLQGLEDVKKDILELYIQAFGN